MQPSKNRIEAVAKWQYALVEGGGFRYACQVKPTGFVIAKFGAELATKGIQEKNVPCNPWRRTTAV